MPQLEMKYLVFTYKEIHRTHYRSQRVAQCIGTNCESIHDLPSNIIYPMVVAVIAVVAAAAVTCGMKMPNSLVSTNLHSKRIEPECKKSSI